MRQSRGMRWGSTAREALEAGWSGMLLDVSGGTVSSSSYRE